MQVDVDRVKLLEDVGWTLVHLIPRHGLCQLLIGYELAAVEAVQRYHGLDNLFAIIDPDFARILDVSRLQD